MRKLVSWAGAVLALGFLGLVLARGAGDLPVLNLRSGTLWLGLLGGLLLYIASQIIGAAAWKAVLRIYDIDLARGRAESQLLVSQIGKYIPGNVAHLFGRMALAHDDGVPRTIAAASMLLEVAALLTTGLLIVVALLIATPDLMTSLTANLPDTSRAILPGLAIGAVLVGLVIGQIIIWRRAGRPTPRPAKFALPLALHAVNFALLGLSLWGVTKAIEPDANVTLFHCIAIFTTAWVAGFLMPGAPGGVGIRDGIIALGLELFIGPGTGIGVAVAHRIISVLGDLVVFGIGLLLRRRC